MKKNFIKYIAALAVAPMLLSSCSDDFLNEIDPNRQTPTTFWTSEDNVMKGLSAVYNPFRRMTSGYYGGLEGIMHLQMRGCWRRRPGTHPDRGSWPQSSGWPEPRSHPGHAWGWPQGPEAHPACGRREWSRSFSHTSRWRDRKSVV